MVPKTEYDELNDHYKRILAEFDNYKKRSQKEKHPPCEKETSP